MTPAELEAWAKKRGWEEVTRYPDGTILYITPKDVIINVYPNGNNVLLWNRVIGG